MQDTPSQSEHSLVELLKQVATTMAREGVARVSVTSETAPPCPTGEELSDMLEKAFLGPDFSHVLDEAITACAANHAKGQSYCFRTNSYKDSYVYPGKKFPTKCFIQHSRFNIQAATRLGDFIHRFSGDSRINDRLACIDGYYREYETAKQAQDEVNKKDFVCILNRE